MGPRYAQWLWSAETLCRVTPYQIVNYVAERMRQLYVTDPKALRVWLLHANLGNEAAQLIEHGFHVICSEPDAAALCRRNLENAGLGAALRLALELDIDDAAQWPDVDVALLNPPWGAAYQRARRQHFDLAQVQVGERTFLEQFDAVRERYGNVVVVTPARSVRFDQHRPCDAVLEFTKLRILFYCKVFPGS
jgi:23S rRNA G2445 N2-methylase RlmL